jgi:hypothetical protein
LAQASNIATAFLRHWTNKVAAADTINIETKCFRMGFSPIFWLNQIALEPAGAPALLESLFSLLSPACLARSRGIIAVSASSRVL